MDEDIIRDNDDEFKKACMGNDKNYIASMKLIVRRKLRFRIFLFCWMFFAQVPITFLYTYSRMSEGRYMNAAIHICIDLALVFWYAHLINGFARDAQETRDQAASFIREARRVQKQMLAVGRDLRAGDTDSADKILSSLTKPYS